VPRSFCYATLMLYDIPGKRAIEITGNVELSLSGPNALWSPDSRFFVYAKGGKLFYYSIDQLKDRRIVAEDFRVIGQGTIANIQWARENSLYYISESLVYQIYSGEFFTRSIYTGLLEMGRIAGKIPFKFDPNFDSFWISPTGGKILLAKGGRNIFLYFLETDDYISTGETKSLPYLFLPRNTRLKRVLWSGSDIITLLAGSVVSGENKTSIFRLDLGKKQESYAFKQTDETGVRDIVLSWNEGRAAVIKGDTIVIRKYSTWEDEKVFTQPRPLFLLWKSENELIAAGTYFINNLYIQENSEEVLCFAQVERYGFAKDTRNIQVEVKNQAYEYIGETDEWKQIQNLNTGIEKVYSSHFRVYLERSSTGSYRNMVMVRDIKGYGTSTLFKPPLQQYESFPVTEESVDFVNFTHGSRIRRREVSLVFNAIDTVEGLTEILNTLSEYGLSATFFVNGEFIHRHPGAVKEMAESGHEVGSLFYTHFNMTDARFKVDKEFIKRGLARNEDNYFKVTGRELSLLWHAPYYFINTDIIDASREMNYVYVGRDIDSLDWVTEEQARTLTGLYMAVPQLIERIMKMKKPGSIIPVRIGQVEGKREDYLFNKLDILINSLISLGYDIVPVSTLIEHAR
ncbi:MAG: polysaccharide deacetylase family protein, partial [Spirochaetota bacterium]